MARRKITKTCPNCDREYQTRFKKQICCSNRCRGFFQVRPSQSDRFARQVATGSTSACWPWAGTCDSNGYGLIWWDGRGDRAHRVAWIVANGPIPDGQLIRHKCDNPPCCNPSHLEPGSHADNASDMAKRGRSTFGERNPRAKTTEAEIELIRRDGRSQREIAADFGLSQSHICAIKSGRFWKHPRKKTNQ